MVLNPLIKYSINKFMLLFIPKLLLDYLPAMLTSLIVTIVPYTPINVIVFSLIFLVIYLVNPFGMSNQSIHYCRFNKSNVRTEISVWTTMGNAYYFYFLVMMMVNYNTVSQYQSFNVSMV